MRRIKKKSTKMRKKEKEENENWVDENEKD